MTPLTARNDVIQQLQKEIISLQGYGNTCGEPILHKGLGVIEQSFPGQVFPNGAIHEFLSLSPEDAAATNGFIAGLLSHFIQDTGACLWISIRRSIFPPALKLFGIAPERIIFVDLARERDALWAIEEALKCEVLAAVVGELSEVSFTASRRLQLAVEESRVIGFIHRHRPKSENTLACVSRWKIRPLPSATEEGLPGVGFPRWNVKLAKVRNGKPGTWNLEWGGSAFRYLPTFVPAISKGLIQKTG